MKIKHTIAALLACSLLQGCVVDQVIDGTEVNGEPNPTTTLGWSENGAYAKQGRFFIVGGQVPIYFNQSSIFEVVKNDDGGYENISIVDGEINGNQCYFGGLTSKANKLYSACVQMAFVELPGFPQPLFLPVANKLYVVDLDQPTDSEDYITTTLLQTPLLSSNGMAVDNNGDLYISNSMSFMANLSGIPGVPAIVKVSLGDTIIESPWLAADQGGMSPNGLQYQNGSLYLASGNSLTKIQIQEDGTAGAVTPVYMADPSILIDDFDIKNNIIAASQIKTIIPDIVLMLYPDAVIPEEPISKVVLINTRNGKELGEQSFSGKALPSSVKFGKWPLFESYSLIVTDAIGTGGLYQLTIEQSDFQ